MPEIKDLAAIVEAVLAVAGEPVALDALLAVAGEGTRARPRGGGGRVRAPQARAGGERRSRSSTSAGDGVWRRGPEHEGALRGVPRVPLAGAPVAGGARDAGDRRLPPADHAARDQLPARRQLRRRWCRTLLERKLVAVAGRKQVVGTPLLYRTSKEFLVHFGLSDLSAPADSGGGGAGDRGRCQ